MYFLQLILSRVSKSKFDAGEKCCEMNRKAALLFLPVDPIETVSKSQFDDEMNRFDFLQLINSIIICEEKGLIICGEVLIIENVCLSCTM